MPLRELARALTHLDESDQGSSGSGVSCLKALQVQVLLPSILLNQCLVCQVTLPPPQAVRSCLWLHHSPHNSQRCCLGQRTKAPTTASVVASASAPKPPLQPGTAIPCPLTNSPPSPSDSHAQCRAGGHAAYAQALPEPERRDVWPHPKEAAPGHVVHAF